MDITKDLVRAQEQWNTFACGELEGVENPDLAYFKRVEENRYQTTNHKFLFDFCQFNSFKGKNVLEIGIGQGTDLLQFAKGGANCHGIDVTDNHLRLTKKNFEVHNFNLELKKCSATDIDYPESYFDVIYSMGVIHHIESAQRVFDEVYRCLKPGGEFYVALYNKWSVFHLSKLLFQGILKGKLLTIGYDGLLSTIETGADGKNLKPYVKLYDRKDVTSALHMFKNISISYGLLEKEHFLNKTLGSLFIGMMPKSSSWYIMSSAQK